MKIPRDCVGCIASCVCETMNVPGCDECVEFYKLVEKKLNSNQQLKAKIASIANHMESYKSSLDSAKNNFVYELRQLSAI